MLKFAFATLLPAGLLISATVIGGIWVWIALGCVSVLAYGMDRLTHGIALPLTTKSTARALSTVLAVLHFILWPFAILSVAGLGAPAGIDRIGAFFAFGLFFGQISNSNAHDLIHGSKRWEQILGWALYASLLFGHHYSAHRLVHHQHAATDRDPNTARRGEGFWRFFPRAATGAFIEGLRAESRLRSRRAGRIGPHPYMFHIVGALWALTLAYALGDLMGFFSLITLAVYAQLQLFLSDYVQHYGLTRRIQLNGKPEPIGPQHSWNAPHWYTAAMMLNAPRHSDHHMRPRRSYAELELDAATMPMLPHSLPVMAMIALIPPLWRKMMAPRVRLWMGDNPAAGTQIDKNLQPEKA